jgi:hypothetical protein
MTASESIVRELRALRLDAPPALRERVRALGEPPPRRSFPAVPWRRSLLVLAPACVLAVLVAAVVHGVTSSDRTTTSVVAGEAGGGAARDQLLSPSLGFLPPDSGRRQDYEASMTLRVKDLDALTAQTNEAMRIVRSFGGYVASVQQSTAAGKPGQADLVLRVPVGRVETALVQLSALGTVLDRRLSIVDLEQTLRQQRARIVRLKVFIARAVEQLKGDLPADVRLRLQLQLQAARADLARATRAHGSTLNQAALSRIALTLTTQQTAAPTPKAGTGRWERAARDAGAFLADAGAVVLFLLIVLSPVLVLILACALGWRAYRRREERRLLAA